MNFNSDLSKIPLPPYPSIPGLSDLIEELPQTAQGQLHNLPHHDNRHEAVSKVLTTPDSMLVSQIVDAFQGNPTELISNQRDPTSLEGVNVQPLLQGVSPSDVYNHRNLMQISGSLNPSLSHVAPFVTPNPSVGNPMSAIFSTDPVPNSRISSLYPGTANRPVTTRPVQAVAPQPRNPQVSEKVESSDTHRTAIEHKMPPSTPNPTPDPPPPQQENPKICLKIKRTKKAHKDKKHSSKHSSEYGVVQPETKPERAGPIKLKISRLKSSGSSQNNKSSSSEQTFTVSSLTTNETSKKDSALEDKDKQSAEESVHHPAESLKDAFQRASGHSAKSKSSKNEKHSHKHHHRSPKSSSSQMVDNQPPKSHLPLQQSSSTSQSHSFHPFLASHSVPSPTIGKSIDTNRLVRTSTYSPVPSVPNQTDSTSANLTSAQQNLLTSQYLTSSMDQQTQQLMQQQQQFMASFASNPLAHIPYPASFPTTTGLQGQTSYPGNSWDVGKTESRSSSQQSGSLSGSNRPPPYKEAMLNQQRFQNQFYQSLQQANLPLQQQQLMQKQQEELQKQKDLQIKQQQLELQKKQQLELQKKQQLELQKKQQQELMRQQQERELLKQKEMQKRKLHQPYLPQPSDYHQKQFVPVQQTQPQMQPFSHHQAQMLQPFIPPPPSQTSQNYTPSHTDMVDPNLIFHQQQPRPQPVPPKKKPIAHSMEAILPPTPQIPLPPTPSTSMSSAQPRSPPPKHRKQSQPSSQLNQPTPLKTHLTPNYSNTPRQSTMRSSTATSKAKKKGSAQHVRVKFIADAEEADIYKLKDIMYPDDTEVSSFDDLNPGDEVIAKWPMNGKLYSAMVIDPLDNTGRKFRERKPPPKPFQAQLGSSKRDRKVDGPAVVLDKLAKDNLPPGLKLREPLPEDPKDGFHAYISMADRIKLKKRERLAREARNREGKKRKREDSSGDLINLESDESDSEFSSPSKKRSHQSELRKRERRKMAEMKFSHEDGAGSFQRLLNTIQQIFDDVDTIDPRILDEAVNGEKGASVPQCVLISNARLHELNGETAKLKALGLLSQFPRKRLVRLLTILEPNIRDAVHLKPLKLKGNSPEEQKWNRDCRLDRVSRSTEAALTVMNIMTARSMPKAVYIDDVIERTVQLLRHQLMSTIYPEYDPVYRFPSQNKKKGAKELTSFASTRMKRAHYKGPKNRHILQLYNKLNILLNHIVELVDIQPLTDTSILQISTLGISPFFVENVRELQLSAIRLITSVFSKYDKHRSLILEDIFQSLARLPTSKRNLRSYRLTYAEEAVDSSDEEEASTKKKPGVIGANGELQYIQMMTALVLQMVHAIAHLPLPDLIDEELSKEDQELQHQVDEMKVITSYDTAGRTGQNFLSVFLKKCASKSEEIDYRPLFENVIHDLLATVNKPEWPASEMMLSSLGRILVHTFSTKSTEMSLRVAALDYLGVVAAKLRRDAVSSFTNVETIRALLKRLEDAAKDEDAENQPMEQEQEEKPEGKEIKTEEPEVKMETKKKKPKLGVESEDDVVTRQLQYILLGYLRQNASADPALLFAHHFYIAQWLRDITQEFQQIQQREEKGEDAGVQMESQSKALQACQLKKDKLMELASSAGIASFLISEPQLDEKEQKKLKKKINDQQKKADKLALGLTVEDAALISRYLASSRPFSKAFDSYLSYILRVKDETAVALRTRAIKCLAEVVAVDPSIMERDDIAQGVQNSLIDTSTSVREAAIDLVGRFILLKPELVKYYYNMLTARILDTGVSVRKRVIKILRDVCHEHPTLPQLTDACVKMIRRVNDEEGIKKLVHEVFMKMWFTPADPHDTESLRKKALMITDIVAANRERGYEWVEQLFKNLIDTPTRNPKVEEACRQIVNCLIEHVIVFENTEKKSKEPTTETSENESDTEVKTEENDTAKSKDRSIRLVATVQTLVQLAKIRPKLLVPHVMTLQPYLATKCDTPDDVLTIHGVCRTLELAIPLMEHPSEAFLASIEEDMMRMILTHRFHVVSGAVACLGAVTLRVTHNYRLIWDCFQKMCAGLSNARKFHEQNPDNSGIFHPMRLKQLLRTLFIIGHFCKNFDFDNESIKGKSLGNVCVKDKLYDCLYYFTRLPVNSVTEELCVYSIAALGHLMIQDPNMMFRNTTRDLYKEFLDANQKSIHLKNRVLQNLQTYLQAEDVKMQEAAEASAKKAKHEEDTERLNEAEVRAAEGDPGVLEDIKEICDVSSGMASSVMQLFLKQVLEAFFHRHVIVRHAALHTVYLTLQQGLVHPVQCIPYLIAAASDPEASVHKEADQQLTELSKRYHGFVHTKALHGMRQAYQLQSYVQPAGQPVRGFVERSATGLDDGSGTNLKASCSQLYLLVRPDRKHRRALLLSLLNMFDDTIKTDVQMLVFVADNLAYFPYHTLDEPLYLISQIEVYVSVSGSNVLQSFKEALRTKSSKKAEREAKKAARLQKLEERRKRREARREERGEDESGDSDSSSSSFSSSSESSSSSSDDDDESDDESAIESRLPERNEAIEEFAHLSLACLLLLWLKHHLKTVFGFTDNKIHRYSPSEVNRANDKLCHRKRPDLRFDPHPALSHIDRLKRKVHCRDPEYIDAVVRQYTEFNELMNKLDPNDEDSDSDREKNTSKNTPNTSEVKPKDVDEMEESDRDTDGETKQAGTLDAIRQSTALKTKKVKKRDQRGFTDDSRAAPPQMRERGAVKYIESSSDSEEEFRGF